MLVDLLAPSANGAWWRVANDEVVGYVSVDFLHPTGELSASTILTLTCRFRMRVSCRRSGATQPTWRCG
jgi:hypothetical protein